MAVAKKYLVKSLTWTPAGSSIVQTFTGLAEVSVSDQGALVPKKDMGKVRAQGFVVPDLSETVTIACDDLANTVKSGDVGALTCLATELTSGSTQGSDGTLTIATAVVASSGFGFDGGAGNRKNITMQVVSADGLASGISWTPAA